tara:strand:+ start:16223 stop:17683 length:1461 start_codon:yes stop_codon:yes gene_type:complete
VNSDLALFLKSSEEILGGENVLSIRNQGLSNILKFSVDWRKKFFGKPLAVCFPNSSSQVSELVKLADKFNVPLIAQGGNTGLSGGATPSNDISQVVISMSRMNSIRSIDIVNKSLTVESGCSLRKLQDFAKNSSLLFPLDISSREDATIGGILATNAGGLSVLRYGSARDLCFGLEVVLSDGKIWNGLKSLKKDNSGYSLKNLFIGSEGTLGIITAASMCLYSEVLDRETYFVITRDITATVAVYNELQKIVNDNLTAFEFMSSDAIDLVMRYFPNRVPNFIGNIKSKIISIVELPRTNLYKDECLTERFEQLISSGIVFKWGFCKNKQATKLWALREAITYASAENGQQVKNDLSLPRSSISDFVTSVRKSILPKYPRVSLINFGHIGDGNLHFNVSPFFNEAFQKKEDRWKAHEVFLKKYEEKIRKDINDLVVDFSGSVSAEHGIGQLRREENIRLKSDVEINLMRGIKQYFDPKGIMNPGKLI